MADPKCSHCGEAMVTAGPGLGWFCKNLCAAKATMKMPMSDEKCPKCSAAVSQRATSNCRAMRPRGSADDGTVIYECGASSHKLYRHDTKCLLRQLAAKDKELTFLRTASCPLDREFLGRLVRLTWVEWARSQDNPKPHWLTSWDELSEPMKEVDRLIGEKVATVSTALMERELTTLRVERNKLRLAAKTAIVELENATREVQQEGNLVIRPDGKNEWLCEACGTTQDADTEADADGCCPACSMSKAGKE